MTGPRLRRLRWLVISLMLTTAGVVPLAYWLTPHAVRRHLLGKLTSADLDQRQRGLNYVIRRAGQQRRVFEGALRQALRTMGSGDRENFIQIVSALQLAGTWRCPPVPSDPWLYWIGILGDDPDPESRLLAVQQVAQLHHLATDHRLAELLATWLTDQRAELVRYNALVAAAELAGATEDNAAYADLIAQATLDPAPQIARQGWIFRGLLRRPGLDANTQPGTTGSLATTGAEPPEVAAARLWALSRIDPEYVAPAIATLHDSALDPAVRAMAVYTLALSPDANAQRALSDCLAAGRDAVTDDNLPIVWRAMLTPHRRTALPASFLAGDDALHWAAAYRRGLADDNEPPDEHLVLRLAQLEGTPVGRRRLDIPAEWSDTLRLAALAVTAAPDPAALGRICASPLPGLRDAACVIAADRFTPEQNEALIASLLTDFSDDAKRSGAILAGLTGLQGPLLAAKMRDEDVWAVRQIHRLGLWMQGREPDLDNAVQGLLTRDDLPTTTVLLAMLHRRHPAALDTILAPRVDEPEFSRQALNLPKGEGDATVSLKELLFHYRWWHVLRRFLPADAPPLWLWADDPLQQFQLDVLRNWHLITPGSRPRKPAAE